ncbi:MAG TPA: hypothetical protein VG387_14515 [Rhizomicrobium sp.]|nr:hypothetical protein [Rhizomicrobium sp.]
MRYLLTASVLLCVLSSGPVLADTTTDATTAAPAVAAAPAATAPADDKLICKEMAAPTGSRVGAQKICATQAQWNAHFHGQSIDGANGVYVPGLATAGGMPSPQAVPHGGGHGL